MRLGPGASQAASARRPPGPITFAAFSSHLRGAMRPSGLMLIIGVLAAAPLGLGAGGRPRRQHLHRGEPRRGLVHPAGRGGRGRVSPDRPGARRRAATSSPAARAPSPGPISSFRCTTYFAIRPELLFSLKGGSTVATIRVGSKKTSISSWPTSSCPCCSGYRSPPATSRRCSSAGQPWRSRSGAISASIATHGPVHLRPGQI